MKCSELTYESSLAFHCFDAACWTPGKISMPSTIHIPLTQSSKFPFQTLFRTSSSATAERPCELDQRFQVGDLRLNYSLKGYFSYQCDMTQFTLTHHMVNKPFLLLGLAAEYRSRRWIRGWMRSTLRPTIRCL